METPSTSEPGLLLRILRNPLVTILVVGIALTIVNFAGLGLVQAVLDVPVLPLLLGVAITALMLLVYWSYGHYVERRTVSEFALPYLGRELGFGLLVGFGLMAVCVFIAMVFGIYRPEGIDSIWNLVPSGAVLVIPFWEEMVFRGLIFRIVQLKYGSWVALVVSSVVWGGFHAANEGETFAGVASIVFIYGPMLAAPFMLTGRLWMSIGLHGAWNYTMGAVFGIAVSGVTAEGLLKATMEGPELLTGGIAGMEGSVIAWVVGLTATVIMLTLAVRRGKVVPPPWKRNAPELSTASSSS